MDYYTSMNLHRNIDGNKSDQKLAAIARNYFYNQDHYAIKNYLALDLQNTYSLEDIPDLRYITIDFLVSMFLQKLVNVYNVPPVFNFDATVKKADKDRFTELMEEIKYQEKFQDIGYRCRLHNTTLAQVKYNTELNKLYLGLDYDAGNCEIVEWPDYNYDAQIIAYEFELGGKFIWVVWDKRNKLHYYVENEFKYDPKSQDVIGKKRPIPGNGSIAMPDYWPWQIYRYKEQNEEFWGNGLDAIIELNRVMNVLLTLCADDIANETLAVWLYNFNPEKAGNKREDGKIKVGFRNPMWVESRTSQGNDPSVQVARADLFVDDIIKFIESIMDMISSLHGIENVLKSNLTENLAGISIRLKNEPLLRQWRDDINIFKGQDYELIEKIIAVNNYYRNGKLKDFEGNVIENNYIDPVIIEKLVIDYQQPSVVTDEMADFELFAERVKKGLDTWAGKLREENPEMTPDEAMEKILANLKENDEIYGERFEINPEKINVTGSEKEEGEDDGNKEVVGEAGQNNEPVSGKTTQDSN